MSLTSDALITSARLQVQQLVSQLTQLLWRPHGGERVTDGAGAAPRALTPPPSPFTVPGMQVRLPSLTSNRPQARQRSALVARHLWLKATKM